MIENYTLKIGKNKYLTSDQWRKQLISILTGSSLDELLDFNSYEKKQTNDDCKT